MEKSFDRDVLREAGEALDHARSVLRGMSGLNRRGTSLGPAENNAMVAFESAEPLERLSTSLREAGFGDLAERVPAPIEKTAGPMGLDGRRLLEMLRAGQMCMELTQIRRELDALAPGVLGEDVPHRLMDAEGWAIIVRSPIFWTAVVVWNVGILAFLFLW